MKTLSLRRSLALAGLLAGARVFAATPPASLPVTPPVTPTPAAPPAAAAVPAQAGRIPASLALRQGLARGAAITGFIDLRDDQGQAVPLTDARALHMEIGPYPVGLTTVAPASAGNAGRATIFLVDVSRSVTEGQFAQIRAALKGWTERLGPADRMAIVTFGEAVTLALDFNHDVQSIMATIDRLRPADAHTRLHDALLRGLDLGQRQDAGLPDQRALVLLSDGLDDTAGGANPMEVLSALESAPLPVYAIGFDPGGRRTRREQGFRTLGGFARASGGEFIAATGDRLAEAYETVRRRLDEMLVLRGDCPACPGDGRVYPVQLSLQDGTRVITGNGHVRLLPGPPPQPAPATPPPGVWERATGWLPPSLRPHAGALLGVILALTGLGLILWRLRRRPAEHEVMPAAEPVAELPMTPSEPPSTRVAGTVAVEEDAGLRLRLSVVEGARPGQGWGVMLSDRINLGRSPDNDVVVGDDPEVSGRHCVLIRQGDRIFLEDLQSTNGAFINGVRIVARYRLEEGDLIGLGRTSLRLTQG